MTSIWLQKAAYVSVCKLLHCCTQCVQSHKPWKVREVSVIMSSSPGADPVSKLGGGGDFSNIWYSTLITCLLCKRFEVYFTTLLWQKNGRQNGLIWRMMFSELHKIAVRKVAFVGVGRIAPIASLDPHLLQPPVQCQARVNHTVILMKFLFWYSCNKNLSLWQRNGNTTNAVWLFSVFKHSVWPFSGLFSGLFIFLLKFWSGNPDWNHFVAYATLFLAELLLLLLRRYWRF